MRVDNPATIQPMTQRHRIQNGKVMLITTNTTDDMPYFQDDAYAREAIETLYRVQQLHRFHLYGFVIMHDHCHFLLYIPKPGSISKIMNVYKSGVTFNTGIPKVWQPRFDSRIVNNPVGALHYIHMNPVKENLVKKPEDYPWSSASGKWEVAPIEGAESFMHSFK